MCRYRLEPTAAQDDALLRHCADARYMWNLCVEQEACWRAGRGRMPWLAGRCRRLTEARADNPWLAEGGVIVQQQAIRDHAQAMANFFAGTHRRPRWHKRGQDEGFVNAARNIAAGHAVKARGGDRDTGPVNREPQLALLSA